MILFQITEIFLGTLIKQKAKINEDIFHTVEIFVKLVMMQSLCFITACLIVPLEIQNLYKDV